MALRQGCSWVRPTDTLQALSQVVGRPALTWALSSTSLLPSPGGYTCHPLLWSQLHKGIKAQMVACSQALSPGGQCRAQQTPLLLGFLEPRACGECEFVVWEPKILLPGFSWRRWRRRRNSTLQTDAAAKPAAGVPCVGVKPGQLPLATSDDLGTWERVKMLYRLFAHRDLQHVCPHVNAACVWEERLGGWAHSHAWWAWACV